VQEAHVRCGDYVNGLPRTEEALERSARTGILLRHMPDLWIRKAELLSTKAQQEGNEALQEEAESLLKQALDYVELHELRGKQAKFSLTLAKLLKRSGKHEALEDFKPQVVALLTESAGNNVPIRFPWGVKA
jgi:hypothetical protein